MNVKKLSILTVSLTLTLVGCGTVEVTKSRDGTMNVTSDQGTSLNGGWAHASAEAVKKATEFCAANGEIPHFFNESRGGVPGWSKLSSSINFSCGPDASKTGKAITEKYQERLKRDTELLPLASKIEFFRESRTPVPFAIASNNDHPTTTEAQLIAKWAKIREDYVREIAELNAKVPIGGDALQQANVKKLRAFGEDITARIAELIVALYNGKLSYGEFARKRYEVSSSLESASEEFQRSVLQADRDAQIRQQALAEQQRANSLAAWSTYMQTVNSRPPVVSPMPSVSPQLLTPNIRLQSNCTSQKIGNTVSTTCN